MTGAVQEHQHTRAAQHAVDRAALHASALNAQDRGWSVVELHRCGPDGRTCSCSQGAACRGAGKHPRAAAWQSGAGLSRADVEALWGPDALGPPSNLGIRTGSASGGLLVVDVDPRHGGEASMRRLIADGVLTPTRVVRTGGGGWHLYYQLPEGVRVTNSTAELRRAGLVGIDLRSEGGQVVAPGSRTSAGVYQVVRNG